MKNPSLVILFVPLLSALVAMAWSAPIPDWAWGMVALGAFGGSWLWWSFAAPRWRVWAVERTDDLGALLVRAISEQIIWRPGSFFERTEIQPREMRLRLRQELRRALARYAETHPEDEASLREFVNPWLYPRRPGARRARAGSSAAFYALLFGILALVIVSSATVLDLLYDRPIPWSGSAGVAVVGLLLLMWGQPRASVSGTFSLSLFLVMFGLRVGASVLRSYPWRTEELGVLVLALAAGGLGYLTLHALGKS